MSLNKTKSSATARGYIFALVAAIFLSTTSILIRYLTLTYNIPALVLALWRDVFVALTLLPVLVFFWPHLVPVNRSNLKYLVIYGFLLALFNSFWTLSVALNGAAIATVMCYCSAGFTALLGWWIFKEELNWVKIVAVLLSLGGCYLVSGAMDQASWNGNLFGILVGVLAGLCYAIYSLMGRSASKRGLNPFTTLFYTFSFATFFLLLVNLWMGNILPGAAPQPIDIFWLGDKWAGWGVLFLLAAIPTLAGFGFYNVSLSYLPSSIANLVVTLEPAFTAITAYFLLGERMNTLQIGGSIMILGGVVFLRVFDTLTSKS
jgi:drug/metabolite transporter (DMT)-like permease